MSESLNETVAAFEHCGRVYEVDFLLDSGIGHGWAYHIFDVTDQPGDKGVCVGEIQMDHPDNLSDRDIIREATAELERGGS